MAEPAVGGELGRPGGHDRECAGLCALQEVMHICVRPLESDARGVTTSGFSWVGQPTTVGGVSP
jgi:hypothetical protein